MKNREKEKEILESFYHTIEKLFIKVDDLASKNQNPTEQEKLNEVRNLILAVVGFHTVLKLEMGLIDRDETCF